MTGFATIKKDFYVIMRGFSLIELTIVMVIIGIVAMAIMFTNMPTRATFDLASICDQLIRDVRYTQILSMTLNGSYSIQVNSNSYQIKNPDGSNFSYPAVNSSPVTLPTGLSLSPAQSISFDSYGRPSAGTTITVSTGSTVRILTLRAQTGFIDG